MSANGNALNPCEQLAGKDVPGERKGKTWKVLQKVVRSSDATGGKFSIGYQARHEDGTLGFLKATDIGLLVKSNAADTPLERMQRALNEQAFERKILEICRGSNLDRIVHAIDHGQIEVTDGGVRDVVFYIIFERAEGDVRTQTSREQRQTLSWTLCALHNLAVAIQQLHVQKIAHNDVKPSNFLVFEQYLQKLADLGRATSEKESGPWDGVKYSGDGNYAAPEFWYYHYTVPKIGNKIDFSVRQASDLFHLGSMGFFLVTGQRLTPLMRTKLRPEHNPLNWNGNFYDVLPYVRDAFGECMIVFESELPKDAKGNLIPEAIALKATIAQLCEPDPDLRGHPLNKTDGNKYGVERYISQFDSQSKILRLREQKK
jgi:serine/threonine protein kinase